MWDRQSQARSVAARGWYDGTDPPAQNSVDRNTERLYGKGQWKRMKSKANVLKARAGGRVITMPRRVRWGGIIDGHSPWWLQYGHQNAKNDVKVLRVLVGTSGVDDIEETPSQDY